MPPRAGSSFSPLALGAKWFEAHASSASRSRPAAQAACTFSTTSSRPRRSKAQHFLHQFLKDRWILRDAKEPTYLGDAPNQPFPMNPFFKSENVLADDMREEIYRRVKQENRPLKEVSADLHVDLRRVAAVIRLKEVEKQWVAEKKPLARPYQEAMLRLLPNTTLARPGQVQTVHESVNEVHVHRFTTQQLFVPVSESRQFNRQDAAKAFHKNMLSADNRSPLKELITMNKDMLQGVPESEARKKFQKDTRAQEDVLIEKERQRLAKAEKNTKRVDTGRFQFRFKEMNVEAAGKDGRGRNAVGWRYGVPFYDRRKGEFKLPTSVP